MEDRNNRFVCSSDIIVLFFTELSSMKDNKYLPSMFGLNIWIKYEQVTRHIVCGYLCVDSLGAYLY